MLPPKHKERSALLRVPKLPASRVPPPKKISPRRTKHERKKMN